MRTQLKTLDPLKWVGLAKSKDATRFNLNDCYCSGDEIVATDGHRLHLVKLDKPRAKGYLTSMIDAEYPDYKQVIPESRANTAELLVTEEQITALKNIRKVIYPKAKTPCPSFRVEIKAKDKILRISSSCCLGAVVVHVECDLPLVDWSGPNSLVRGVNLDYLIDALIPGLECLISFGVTSKGEAPIRIDYDGSDKLTAIVMPVRL